MCRLLESLRWWRKSQMPFHRLSQLHQVLLSQVGWWGEYWKSSRSSDALNAQNSAKSPNTDNGHTTMYSPLPLPGEFCRVLHVYCALFVWILLFCMNMRNLNINTLFLGEKSKMTVGTQVFLSKAVFCLNTCIGRLFLYVGPFFRLWRIFCGEGDGFASVAAFSRYFVFRFVMYVF